MKHVLRKMSPNGDDCVMEWDTDTVTPQDLERIEKEFQQKLSEGYFAANLDTEELIDKFTPDADILLMPRLQGG